MDPILLAAILNFAVKFGFEAARALLSKPVVTLDDAIAALDRAQAKSLQQYIDEDAARRKLPPVP